MLIATNNEPHNASYTKEIRCWCSLPVRERTSASIVCHMHKSYDSTSEPLRTIYQAIILRRQALHPSPHVSYPRPREYISVKQSTKHAMKMQFQSSHTVKTHHLALRWPRAMYIAMMWNSQGVRVPVVNARKRVVTYMQAHEV